MERKVMEVNCEKDNIGRVTQKTKSQKVGRVEKINMQEKRERGM